jgi:GT2 family glycosyltransferase
MNDIPACGESSSTLTEHERALAAADKRARVALEDARALEIDRARLRRDVIRSNATLGLLREDLSRSEAKRRFCGRQRGVAERIRMMMRRLRLPQLAKLIGLIRGSGVFDVGWYLSFDPAIEATRTDPILHYVLHGWREGRDPSPFFSVAWYLRSNPDVATAGVEPLSHYLLYGAAEDREPHPLFLGRRYLERYPDVAEAGANPLVHFVLHGAAERRDPHPLFDSEWYVQTNPDVAAAGLNPFLHYLMRGAAERRDPHPLFDSEWYLTQSPDVAKSGEDPLRHYLQRGAAEGRDPHPLFQTRRYLLRNPDVTSSGVNPLMDFVQHGNRRDDPHPLFSAAWYLANNPDVAAMGMNPLVHFIRFGAKEHRSPHPFFDAKWYVEKNPDVAARGDEPLNHYLKIGARKRRDPHPFFATSWYLKENPDAAYAGVSPLEHYLSTGLRRGAMPSLDISRDQCARLLRQLTEGPIGSASADAWRSWVFPAALQRLLKVFDHADAAAPINALYDLLGRYGGRQISASDLQALPELLLLVDELSQLSRTISLPKQIDATIVIPVHNQIVYTLCCLKSLLGSTARSSFEIIVADDLSSDATAPVISRLGGIVRYHRSSTNLGFTRNCNAAAALARGGTIAFLNNDTIALPHWLDELVASLRADPSIGLIGSKLLNTDGTLQEAGGIVWRDGSAWNFGRGSDAASPEFNYLKDVDYVSGAAVAVRKSVWTSLGGFDEIYAPAYCEDTDLAFRVRALGLRTVYQPFSVVIHHEGVSHGKDVSAGVKAYQVRNNRIFTSRWKDVLSLENLPHGNDVPLARDRSRERPHILVIDHYVPQPDRDAGSRTMNHYLKLFQASGLQVSFWPQNRYFDRPYAQPLQRLGIEILYDLNGGGDAFNEWLELNGRYLEYVFLSRAGVAIEFIDRLRAKTNAKIMLYGHDIHFRRLEMEYAITRNPATDQERAGFAAIERTIWAKSDVIYYPSTEECAFVLSECPSKCVRTMPAFIYSDQGIRGTRERLMTYKIPTTQQLLFVGGFRHRPNVDAMLWFMRDIWPLIVAVAPHVQLCIAGSFPPPEIEALAGGDTAVTGAVSDSMLRQLYLSSQAAIVPLRFGGGVKGKVLEALSYGTPVVTTSVGVQGIPEAPSFAEICDSGENFAASVVDIIRNPDAHLSKTLAGLDFIMKTASESAARKVLGQDIPELVKRRAAPRQRDGENALGPRPAPAG